VKRGFREDTPGEDEENSDDHFDNGEEPPSCNVGDGRIGRTGLRDFEELGGHTVLEEGPATENDS